MTLDEYIQIEEILAEAKAYGLRNEVEISAQKLISEGYSRLDSYVLSFNEWVK